MKIFCVTVKSGTAFEHLAVRANTSDEAVARARSQGLTLSVTGSVYEISEYGTRFCHAILN